MGKSWVKAGVIGGLILFVWGYVSWMVLPWHEMTMHKFQNEIEVGHVIARNASHDGMYIVPCGHCSSDAKEKMEAAAKGKTHMEAPAYKGPFMFASVRLAGMPSSMTKHIIIGLFIQLLAAFVGAWVLMQTKGLKYLKKVRLFVILGIFSGILSYLPMWNWMGASVGYTVVGIADLAIGWLLAGFAMAKVSS